MYFNVNVTGSSYTQATGVIEVSVFNGTPPYLIEYRTFNGFPFPGLKIDDGIYIGYPQYAKVINIPIGFYYIDVTDQYGAGTKITECVFIGYSGYTQQNINHTPVNETIIFPCETESCHPEIECNKPDFYWIQTEDGCYLNLAFNECLDNCWLVGGYCIPEDGCLIIDEVGIGVADECGWTFLNEDGNPPF